MRQAVFGWASAAFLALLVLLETLGRTPLHTEVVYLLGIATALILAFLLAKHLVAPVEQLRDELRGLGQNRSILDLHGHPYPELRDMALKINDLTAQSRNAANLRRDFFANASHELKTPITSIKGSAELLCADIPLTDEQRKELLTRIGLEAERMHSLINDIIMISRLESGGVIGEREDIDLAQTVRDYCDELAPLVEQNQLRLDFHLEPVTLRANRKNIDEVVGNLILNAVNYTPPEGRVEIRLSSDVKKLTLTIRNDAEPIAEEHQRRIFERFYRIDRGRSKAVGGTGLGLSIVKHAVERLGGTVSLESNEDVGVLFTVCLPR